MTDDRKRVPKLSNLGYLILSAATADPEDCIHAYRCRIWDGGWKPNWTRFDEALAKLITDGLVVANDELSHTRHTITKPGRKALSRSLRFYRAMASG